MDAKLLLVKAITLLYLNGKLDDKHNDAIPVAKDVMEYVKPRDKFLNTEFGESDPINELRETLTHMANQPSGTEFDESELKQRFRLNVKHDDSLYSALISGFVLDSDPQEKIQKMWEERENKQKVYQSVCLFGGLLLIIVLL